MKIVHVIPYFQPKLGYQEYYLAREQQEMGHEVCVVTSDRYYPFPDFSRNVGKILGKRYVGQGVFTEEEIKTIRLPLLFEVASNLFLRGFKETLADLNPDVVHAHITTSPITMEAIVLKDLFHFKTVIDCHMDYTLESTSKKRRLLFHIWSKNPYCRKILRRADGYIAISESSRRWLTREWGIRREKIVMIPLGADTHIFSPDSSGRKIMRKQLRIAEEDILIVSAGKIHPKKDLEVLLRAIAPLIKKYRNVKTLLIGGGSEEYMEKLHQLVRRFDIKDNVLFYPFQHKTVLPDYYNASDIGVWPGQDSITIVEAMATGLPIIIPRSYRNIHYIENGNGFHFRRDSWKELMEYLEQLIVDEKMRKKMSLKSRRLVETKLGWDVIAKNTIDLYMKSMI